MGLRESIHDTDPESWCYSVPDAVVEHAHAFPSRRRSAPHAKSLSALAHHLSWASPSDRSPWTTSKSTCASLSHDSLSRFSSSEHRSTTTEEEAEVRPGPEHGPLARTHARVQKRRLDANFRSRMNPSEAEGSFPPSRRCTPREESSEEEERLRPSALVECASSPSARASDEL